MFKLPFELLLGMRYTRAKKRNGFISFISLSSIIGIALGVTALVTVMSIMNGFQQELRDRILDMTAHMTLSERGERLHHWQDLYGIVKTLPHVKGAAPNAMGQGMLTAGDRVKGVLVRGILPQYEGQVADVQSKMIYGQMDDLKSRDYNIILGTELANGLGVSVGDKVTLVAPQASISPMGIMPRLKRFTVSGLFEVGMHEYDSALALVHMNDAQRVFKLGDAVSALQLRLDDLFAVRTVRNEIADDIDQVLYIRDWTQQHANFFKAIEMEKRMMFIVLALIIMVAAFNIVSTMVMVVTDKQKDIAVLRTIGASPASIQTIFMVQGLIIGIVGALMGIVGGVTISLNIDVIVPFIENLFGFKFFPADIYYISKIPSDLHWEDVWVVSGLAFILTLLATIYPARRAAKTQPAEALRYE
ncbi:cell division protein FtsX [Thiomicrospira sp. XS5]|jgi:lipoprotein releasing system, transmembrane protein, LolC/E family|uniref:lipoprotein-releasing ABC transporter permease subunit n=1 Tax=unclassified Thiomicrospira TaxID=2643099 RepID=UPI0004A6CC6C|nr:MULTISPECIES: lipoprotein-releasing ABC transporter permease subunit [unclassified Thiomicrospira]AZR82130.1 cell division protein FtsX [Thiomicrospira sp. S5]KUJ75237.1 cell division protein FtsX [Thiomicrospira sp. XS5]